MRSALSKEMGGQRALRGPTGAATGLEAFRQQLEPATDLVEDWDLPVHAALGVLAQAGACKSSARLGKIGSTGGVHGTGGSPVPIFYLS
jgi:hypothetical protein